MQPALSAKLKELGYSDSLTVITAEHVLFVLHKLLQLGPEPGNEDGSHAEQSALDVAGAAGCLQKLGIHLTAELLRAEKSQQELALFLTDLADLVLECGRLEAWDQEGTVDTQLLQTAASGCAELRGSDLRLFKACPELQSATLASSDCSLLSLSDALVSQQRHGGAGSAADRPAGAAVIDSQAWLRQNDALELALRDYMEAEKSFGQAHAEALKRWTAAPTVSDGAALGQNVPAAYEQHQMMRRLLDALGLLQQAHTQMCIQDNQATQAQEELRLRQQVQFCMAEGSKLASMQAGITSAQTQPFSYSEVLNVL